MTIEIMKYYFKNKLWNIERLNTLLNAQKITQEEYDEIISAGKED